MNRPLTAAELEHMHQTAEASVSELLSRSGSPLPSASAYMPPQRTPEERAAMRAEFMQETSDLALDASRYAPANAPQPIETTASLEPEVSQPDPVLAAAARPPAPEVTAAPAPEIAVAERAPEPLGTPARIDTSWDLPPDLQARIADAGSQPQAELAVAESPAAALPVFTAPAKKGFFARFVSRVPFIGPKLEARAARQALQNAPKQRREPTFDQKISEKSAVPAATPTTPALTVPALAPAATQPERATVRPAAPSPARGQAAVVAAARAEQLAAFEQQQAQAKAASARTLGQTPTLDLGQAAAPDLGAILTSGLAQLADQVSAAAKASVQANVQAQAAQRPVAPTPMAAPAPQPQAASPVQQPEQQAGPESEQDTPANADAPATTQSTYNDLARAYFQQRDATVRPANLATEASAPSASPSVEEFVELADGSYGPAAEAAAAERLAMAISRGEKAQAATAARTAEAQPASPAMLAAPVPQPEPGHWDRAMAEMQRNSDEALAELQAQQAAPQLPDVADGPDAGTFITTGNTTPSPSDQLRALMEGQDALFAASEPATPEPAAQPTPQPANPHTPQTSFGMSATTTASFGMQGFGAHALTQAVQLEDTTLAHPSQEAPLPTLTASGTVGGSLDIERMQSRELHAETKLVDQLQAWAAPNVTEYTAPEAADDRVLLSDATLDAEHRFEEDRQPIDMQLDQTDYSLAIDEEYAATLEQLQSPADGFRGFRIRNHPEHDDDLSTGRGMW